MQRNIEKKGMDPLILIDYYYGKRSKGYKILVSHGRSVAAKAIAIAKAHPELGADLAFIEEASLLHDIGMFCCYAPKIDCWGKADYILHGFLGAQLLREDEMERHALVCERHVGVGLTKEMIIEADLPIPHRDMCPVSVEEQLICFADKFFSKTHLEEEKTLEQVRQSVGRYGEANLKVFDGMCKRFLE